MLSVITKEHTFAHPQETIGSLTDFVLYCPKQGSIKMRHNEKIDEVQEQRRTSQQAQLLRYVRAE